LIFFSFLLPTRHVLRNVTLTVATASYHAIRA